MLHVLLRESEVTKEWCERLNVVARTGFHVEPRLLLVPSPLLVGEPNGVGGRNLSFLLVLTRNVTPPFATKTGHDFIASFFWGPALIFVRSGGHGF